MFIPMLFNSAVSWRTFPKRKRQCTLVAQISQTISNGSSSGADNPFKMDMG